MRNGEQLTIGYIRHTERLRAWLEAGYRSGTTRPATFVHPFFVANTLHYCRILPTTGRQSHMAGQEGDACLTTDGVVEYYDGEIYNLGVFVASI